MEVSLRKQKTYTQKSNQNIGSFLTVALDTDMAMYMAMAMARASSLLKIG